MKTELIYLGKRIEAPIVLKEGIIDGFQFAILTLGSHPCAYIGIDSTHKFFGLEYDEIGEEFDYPIEVHGGLTYTDDHVSEVESDGFRWWVGWDYGHSGDFHDNSELRMFNAITDRVQGMYGKGDRRWLLDEIYTEVLAIIEQLKKYIK